MYVILKHGRFTLAADCCEYIVLDGSDVIFRDYHKGRAEIEFRRIVSQS